MQKLTNQLKIEIIEKYNNNPNLTMVALAKQYNISQPTLSYLFKSNGVKVNFRHRKYKFQEDIFDNIDSEIKAYWLGFLYGDGGINQTSLKLELSAKDINHLEKFKLFMLGNNPIIKGKKNCYYINYTSKYLTNSLKKYGIIQNKTYLTNTTPQINSNLLKHFYRGILDSDGSINKGIRKKSKANYRIDFTSHHISFLQEIKFWICQQLNKINIGCIRERTNNRNHHWANFCIDGNINFENLYNLFYKDSVIYLDRKYIKATEFLNEIRYQNNIS